jgi:hypothetical protein
MVLTFGVHSCIGQHYTGMAASLAGRKADEDRAPSGDEEDVCC